MSTLKPLPSAVPLNQKPVLPMGYTVVEMNPNARFEGSQICHDFQNTGSCRRAVCSFSHPAQKKYIQSNSSGDAAAEGMGVAGGAVSAVSVPIQAPPTSASALPRSAMASASSQARAMHTDLNPYRTKVLKQQRQQANGQINDKSNEQIEADAAYDEYFLDELDLQDVKVYPKRNLSGPNSIKTYTRHDLLARAHRKFGGPAAFDAKAATLAKNWTPGFSSPETRYFVVQDSPSNTGRARAEKVWYTNSTCHDVLVSAYQEAPTVIMLLVSSERGRAEQFEAHGIMQGLPTTHFPIRWDGHILQGSRGGGHFSVEWNAGSRHGGIPFRLLNRLYVDQDARFHAAGAGACIEIPTNLGEHIVEVINDSGTLGALSRSRSPSPAGYRGKHSSRSRSPFSSRDKQGYRGGGGGGGGGGYNQRYKSSRSRSRSPDRHSSYRGKKQVSRSRSPRRRYSQSRSRSPDQRKRSRSRSRSRGSRSYSRSPSRGAPRRRRSRSRSRSRGRGRGRSRSRSRDRSRSRSRSLSRSPRKSRSPE